MDFHGYGLWAIWNEPTDGGVALFTYQYATNSVTIIADPTNHNDRLWKINKSSLGDVFSITNLQNRSYHIWLVNLTVAY